MGNPRNLELIATIPGDKANSQIFEGQIAEDLQEFHIRGEWYRPAPQVFEYIANIQGVSLHTLKPEWKGRNIESFFGKW